MTFQETLKITQKDDGVYEITELITNVIENSKINIGTCQIFSHNSNSTLLIGDTVNESTKSGTAEFLANLAPKDESVLKRINQGMKNIPKNLHQIIHHSTLSIPVTNAKPGIGVWQGIYFHTHDKTHSHNKLTVTIMGE